MTVAANAERRSCNETAAEARSPGAIDTSSRSFSRLKEHDRLRV
jgi:hypothetical protein